MAIPDLGEDDVAVMNSDQRWRYFTDYARYIDDAPARGPHHAIRVGSTTLSDNDTAPLRKRFEAHVRSLRRRLTPGKKKRPRKNAAQTAKK